MDGVYSADPARVPDAKLYNSLSFQDVVSRDLAVMDTAAVSLCRDNRLPIIVLNIEKEGAIASALRGESVGTLVS